MLPRHALLQLPMFTRTQGAGRGKCRARSGTAFLGRTKQVSGQGEFEAYLSFESDFYFSPKLCPHCIVIWRIVTPFMLLIEYACQVDDCNRALSARHGIACEV